MFTSWSFTSWQRVSDHCMSALYETANATKNTEILIIVEFCLIDFHGWFFTKFIKCFIQDWSLWDWTIITRSLELETHSVLLCVAQIVSKTERGSILCPLEINNHHSGYKWAYSADEECYWGKYSNYILWPWGIFLNQHINLIPRDPKKSTYDLCIDRDNTLWHLIHKDIIMFFCFFLHFLACIHSFIPFLLHMRFHSDAGVTNTGDFLERSF